MAGALGAAGQSATLRRKETMMDAKGVVVQPGHGPVWNISPGRSAALKLQNAETAASVMAFEETAPSGTDTTFHLHHDSDELVYVLSGEFTSRSTIR
jgi:uncharacterized RmlC-like cupin family protein